MKRSVQNVTDIFASQKKHLWRKPHLNRIKWREVTANQRKSNLPPNDHIWSKLRVF